MNTPDELLSFASQVKGHLDEEEGRALYRLALEASGLGPCLEIGSYCGKSAVYLGAACKQRAKTLFTVDHHGGSEEQQPGQPYFDPQTYDPVRKMIDTFPLLRQTIRAAGLEDTVVPVVTRSEVAARDWAIPLGLVFIDGGHAYDTVLSDFLLWSDRIVVGGYLVFHDIYPDPAMGGQAPFEVYKIALGQGSYLELPMVRSLGILRKQGPVVVQQEARG